MQDLNAETHRPQRNAEGSEANTTGTLHENQELIAPLWYSHDLFPLTPALSLREREQRRQRIGVVATRSLVLPLPEGEGWGEGERAFEIEDSGSFAIGSQVSAPLR